MLSSRKERVKMEMRKKREENSCWRSHSEKILRHTESKSYVLVLRNTYSTYDPANPLYHYAT